jgi:hypothetical protein
MCWPEVVASFLEEDPVWLLTVDNSEYLLTCSEGVTINNRDHADQILSNINNQSRRLSRRETIAQVESVRSSHKATRGHTQKAQHCTRRRTQERAPLRTQSPPTFPSREAYSMLVPLPSVDGPRGLRRACRGGCARGDGAAVRSR